MRAYAQSLKALLNRIATLGDLSHRVFRQGCKVRYAFVAEHRPVFPVRAMCRCLRIYPSGFHAWLASLIILFTSGALKQA